MYYLPMRFIREAMRDPASTGAIAASSKGLARLIVDRAELKHARVVVELGPGTGVFTAEIMKRMPVTADYLGIEINQEFVRQLTQRFPSAAIRHASAHDISSLLREQGHADADRIISGIPWMSLPKDMREDMLERVAHALAPGGLFLTFAYFPINHLPRGKAFKELLSEHFSHVVKSPIVVANIPPAFVYICKK